MTARLTVVDDLARKDHYYLGADDYCLFYGEDTARAGFDTPTNDMILNLKKEPSRKNRPEYKWKNWAINRCVEIFKGDLDPKKLTEYTVVPAPPSKRPSHPDYDDRMLQVARKFCEGSTLEYRDLLITTQDRQASHATDRRPSPDELRKTIGINPQCAQPAPKAVLLFDDVLTTGCTFKACKAILQEAYPGIPVVGLFVARRAIPRQKAEALDPDDAL